jgi:hypothetical protein
VNGIDVMLLVFALVLVLVIAVARRRGERGEGLRFTLADRTDPREPVLYLMGCGRAIGPLGWTPPSEFRRDGRLWVRTAADEQRRMYWYGEPQIAVTEDGMPDIGTAMFGELTPPRPPEIDPFVFPQVTPLPQQIRRADAYRGDF